MQMYTITWVLFLHSASIHETFWRGFAKSPNSSNKISRNSKTIYVAYSIQSCSFILHLKGFVDYRNE